jgi:hypothetical protein
LRGFKFEEYLDSLTPSTIIFITSYFNTYSNYSKTPLDDYLCYINRLAQKSGELRLLNLASKYPHNIFIDFQSTHDFEKEVSTIPNVVLLENKGKDRYSQQFEIDTDPKYIDTLDRRNRTLAEYSNQFKEKFEDFAKNCGIEAAELIAISALAPIISSKLLYGMITNVSFLKKTDWRIIPEIINSNFYGVAGHECFYLRHNASKIYLQNWITQRFGERKISEVVSFLGNSKNFFRQNADNNPELTLIALFEKEKLEEEIRKILKNFENNYDEQILIDLERKLPSFFGSISNESYYQIKKDLDSLMKDAEGYYKF